MGVLLKNETRHIETEPVVKNRDTNLELYRIIVMLLIVAHHYVVNSGLTLPEGAIFSDPLSWRSLFLLLFGAWGKIGINCFVLITGYFMCQSQINSKKFFKMVFEVEFYKIFIYLIFLISGYQTFSLTGLVKAIIPITSVETNFMGCFLLFYLCIPFLNILIRHLNEKQHLLLVGLSALIYVVYGTLRVVTMNYVSWFIVLYFIASYLRMYPKRIFENTKLWGWLTGGTVLISAVSVVACVWLGTKIGRNIAYGFVSDSNTFLAVVTAVCSFMWFKNLKIPYKPFINTVATSTLGVFLIHANSSAMRHWLWGDVLHNTAAYDSPWLIVHAVGSVVAVFAVCTVLDMMRIRFLEKRFLRFWDKVWAKLSLWFSTCEKTVVAKFGDDNN